MSFEGRKPIVTALLSQIAAVGVSLVAIQLHFAIAGVDMPVGWKLVIAGVAAGGFAIALRANWGWALFLSLLPSLFVLALRLDLPIWVPAIGLALLVLAMRNSLGQRVPLYLSNDETLQKLCGLVDADARLSSIDLGCGFAAVPIALARHNSNSESRFIGVENAPLPYFVAKFRAAMTGDSRILIHWRSIWEEPLAQYDLVYAFLSPHPMLRLYDKVRREMADGARFISNSFDIPGHPPDVSVPIESGRATALLVWTISPPKKG